MFYIKKTYPMKVNTTNLKKEKIDEIFLEGLILKTQ